MIKPSIKQLINIVYIVFLVLFLFSPLKFHLNVFIHKFIALTPFATPSIIEKKEQVALESYQWQLIDKEAKLFNFEKEKGNVICINFWATWCPPCVAEMPSLQKLYDNYGNKVTFLFIANDDPKRVNAFIQKKGYTFPIYYNTYNKIPAALEHTSIPTTFLIDKSGKIVIKKATVANWYTKQIIAILDKLIVE